MKIQMKGHLKNLSGKKIRYWEEDEILRKAMQIYDEFTDIMNNGLIDMYNQSWDRLHPGYEVDPDDKNDPYNRGFWDLCGDVLKRLAERDKRELGYYILLKKDAPITISKDMEDCWVNIVELRRL